MDDAIVLQREQFAVNSTRSEDGKSWTVQTWSQVVYPQRDGVFRIPAIPLRLAIASEGLESIGGETFTSPLVFTAHTPVELQDKTSWIATTRFEVKESFNKSLDDLKPGDALIRTINMSVSDLPAMMLPEFTAEALPGMAIYQKTPEVMDRVNRGEYIAGRTEVLTYVFEQSGDYQLPAQTYYWWNLRSQSVESIELPAHALKVSPSSATGSEDADQQPAKQVWAGDITRLLKYAAATLILLLSIWFFARKLYRSFIHTRLPHSSLPSERALRRQFKAACRQNNPEKAIPLFYNWLDNYAGDHFQGSVRQFFNKQDQDQLSTAFDGIMRSVYMENDDNRIDLKKFANLYIHELRRSEHPDGVNRWAIELKLN
jgi:hypothetical protein